jgi:predicted nucleic acid-binding protein
MIRVFLDANVLFSAARANSATGRLIAEAGRRAALVYSPDVAEEARRNIQIKRPDAVNELERLIARSEPTDSALFSLGFEMNLNDKAVLCAAIRGGCPYLVTGDTQHFGTLFNQNIQGVTVLSPRQFAELLRTMPPA